jgi:hypothetical protein
MGKSFQLFHVVLVISMATMSHAASDSDPIDTRTFFFPRNKSNMDVSNITWAHAVNSKKELDDALAGDVMMIEADISMGSQNDTSEKIPIMAHPPNTTSDLSFEEFLDTILNHNQNRRGKKGVKLDFKDIDAVEPCLKVLKSKQSQITFPVWLNADVLTGPVDATKSPLEAEKFIKLVKKNYKKGTLSLGWTTRYGNDDSLDGESTKPSIKRGAYLKKHIDDMVNVLIDTKIQAPTFPVRAALAARSSDALLNLLASVSGSTLTLYSSTDDVPFINFDKLRKLIVEVGKTNVYMDLPFNMYNTTEFPSTTVVDDNDTSSSNSTDTNNDNQPDSSAGDLVRGRGMQFVMFIVSLLVINYAF